MTLSRVVALRRYIITKEVVDNVRDTIRAVSVSFETLNGHPRMLIHRRSNPSLKNPTHYFTKMDMDQSTLSLSTLGF